MIGINALAISSATEQVKESFGLDDEKFPDSYWMITTWNLGAALAPLVGLPLMEDAGVRPGYLVSYVLFVLFIIPQALAKNYTTLTLARFFSGAFGSIGQNSVENVITDIWEYADTGSPVTLFIFAYLAGYTFGPVLGSAISLHLHWRW